MGEAFLDIPKIRCLFKALLGDMHLNKINNVKQSRKKGMFDKMGVKAVENLNQKRESS